MKVQGKVFVVTGGGGGIGGELVLGLLDRGAMVAAVDLNHAGLLETQQRAGEAGGRMTTHVLDIADKNAVTQLLTDVIKAHGTVDGLVNNAGIIQPFVRINDLSYDTVDHVMGVNFYGTLYMTKAFLPQLLGRPEAHIVNVSSMGGFLPVPGQGVYGASKAAVKLLTEALYAELLNTPVHVTVVFPGATNTNITQNSNVKAPQVSDEDVAKMAGRMLSPQKAADIIIKGIEANKPQIFTGKDSKLMNRLYRLNPVFATKFIAKQMKSLLG